MDYKTYFLKCREVYGSKKASLKNFYEDPFRIMPKNLLKGETKKVLEEMSIELKNEFDNAKNDSSSFYTIKNIWKYKNSIEQVSNKLLPYLEENMFGCNLYVDKVYIYRTKRIETKKDSYLWHHDNNPNEIVKLIIYLNDVNLDNSPFEYLENEKGKGVLAKCTRLGPENWNPTPNDGRLEEEVKQMIKYDNCHNKKITGEKFTAFAFSNNIIHRANPIINGYRDVLNIRVKPTLNKAPKYSSPKWTTSYEYTGAVNPNPSDNWEMEISLINKIKNKLKRLTKYLFNKIKNI